LRTGFLSWLRCLPWCEIKIHLHGNGRLIFSSNPKCVISFCSASFLL
jgi:hypothetical protein